MQKFINITFPALKKGKPDTYRCFSEYHEDGDSRCFVLSETYRQLNHHNHKVVEGCQIEDMKTGQRFVCNKVVLIPVKKRKYPILYVTAV